MSKDSCSGFPDRLRNAIGDRSVHSVAKGSGVSDSVLRQYLSGKSEPSVSKAYRLAEYLGVSFVGLVAGERMIPIWERERYGKLRTVIMQAYNRAAVEKGADRHATDEPFEDQPMMQITREQGIGFPLGQASKKIRESRRLSVLAARRELLDAIVYIAGAIIELDRQTVEGLDAAEEEAQQLMSDSFREYYRKGHEVPLSSLKAPKEDA